MEPTTLEIIASTLFGCAILHTFTVKRFENIAHRYPNGSLGENAFHMLAEVEVVFGFWAGLLIVAMYSLSGGHFVIEYLEGHSETYIIDYTEPAFVFAIMAMAATKVTSMSSLRRWSSSSSRDSWAIR